MRIVKAQQTLSDYVLGTKFIINTDIAPSSKTCVTTKTDTNTPIINGIQTHLHQT